MAHQVLARKWRPQTFNDMIGQTHVTRALTHALEKNRLHHAYLFTGTRGVGKTSAARIFAKCLNCETGVTATPCRTCDACVAIEEGRFVDLLEIDAASRTKVEDTREILDNVQYLPTRARYKIYLIDEVHMLSGHSFNALLKTLEEPPPHVKFLLATTDPQKLPPTILSRCLQFHLKHMTPEQIASQLQTILHAEQVTYEDAALKQVSLAAQGSMRDALSILDQAIAFSDGTITETDITAMLGITAQTALIDLLQALVQGDPQAGLERIATMAEHASDFSQALEAFLSLLHEIALAQFMPETAAADPVIQDLAQQIPKEDLQLYYQIGLMGRRDLPLAPSQRSGFEMLFLRLLAFQPAPVDSDEALPPQAKPKPTKAKPQAAPATAETASQPAPETVQTPPTSAQAAPITDDPWSNVVSALKLTGIAQSIAVNCSLKQFTADHLELLLDTAHAAMLTDKQQTRLNEAVNEHYKRPIQLTITIDQHSNPTPAAIEEQHRAAKKQAAAENLESDPNVQTIMQAFDTSFDPENVEAS